MATTTSLQNYNMRSATELTGVSEHTLRAWESRHDAVRPSRTPSGRRVYSQQDVDRLRLLAQLVERGNAISSIASLSDRDLAKRLAGSEKPVRKAVAPEPADAAVDVIKSALHGFDLGRVQSAMQEARFRFGARVFAIGIAAPLMAEVGNLVATGELTVAHEHAASAVVKAHLMEMVFSGPRAPTKQRIALATMEGDLHEIGLLISGVLCAHHGFGIVYIGPNMPPDALGEALKALTTDALILGVTELPPGLDRWTVEDYAQIVMRPLPKKHELWLGGVPRREIHLKGVQQRWKHLRSLHELDQILGGWV